jgi:hypothetical protein
METLVWAYGDLSLFGGTYTEMNLFINSDYFAAYSSEPFINSASFSYS